MQERKPLRASHSRTPPDGGYLSTRHNCSQLTIHLVQAGHGPFKGHFLTDSFSQISVVYASVLAAAVGKSGTSGKGGIRPLGLSFPLAPIGKRHQRIGKGEIAFVAILLPSGVVPSAAIRVGACL